MIYMTHETLPHGVATPEFLAELETLPLAEIIRRGRLSTTASAEKALAAGPPDLDQAASLLLSMDGPLQAEIRRAARERTDRVFGRSILLYAPCYLSSHCVNLCTYCGFNYSMPIPRRQLTLPEASEEISILAGRGMRRVLLVAGEHPARIDPDYIAASIRAASALASEIDLEVAPSPARTYRVWVQAGAGGVVCYQETYDRRRYDEVHPRGPKRWYAFRLGAPERAAAAGMRRIGIGILLGLSDPIPDLLALIAHARFLARRYPQASLTVSLPRLRPAVPDFHTPFLVDDDALTRYFAVLRLALPEAGLVVSTREYPATRRRLLEAGITQMSAQSATVPGGYAEQESTGGQFEIADHRSVDEVTGDLAALGYTTRWTSAGEGVNAGVGRPAHGPAA